jgi:hypothetical protein
MKLKPSHPALAEGRTIHPKYVVKADGSKSILKPVASNDKVGKGLSVIVKGAWRGFPLFSVTLEERATCPPDCLRWNECYGNGMMFAHRFEHGPEFEAQLLREVEAAAALYPFGFAVRLHILGDFYSVEYVTLWRNMLDRFPNLHVYGYSAQWQNPIAAAIQATRIKHRDRFWLRFSRNFEYDGENIYAAQEGTRGVQCPEQTGKARSCLDCGLCWAINATIIFKDHDKLSKERKQRKHENSTRSPSAQTLA